MVAGLGLALRRRTSKTIDDAASGGSDDGSDLIDADASELKKEKNGERAIRGRTGIAPAWNRHWVRHLYGIEPALKRALIRH